MSLVNTIVIFIKIFNFKLRFKKKNLLSNWVDFCVEFKCGICGNIDDNTEYSIREMMFGYRENFKYVKCAGCGCLQIKEIPGDMSKYYSENYYSFNEYKNFFRKYISNKRDKYLTGQNSFLGKLLTKRYGYSELYNWFKELSIGINEKILEVGCGEGVLLKKLADIGFNNLTGIDPFVSEDKIYKNKVKIYKQYLEDVKDGEFDFIMLHHSFEHMPNPIGTLIKINKLIKKDNFVVIRIPVIDTFVWNEYNVDWVQLDAPRHFFINSVKSMGVLAEKTGFKVYKTIFDSTSFQFWASEQNKKDIPLNSPNSYLVNPSKSMFNALEIKQFEDRAKELNAAEQGDQAAFFLMKI